MDYTFLILIPFFLLSLWASGRVSATFAKYAKVRVDSGLTGREAAERMLDANGLDIDVQMSTGGHLSDHYDPRSKIIRLSESVYSGNSVSSVSVACHEVGHAIQHAQGYKFLEFRNAIFPVVSLSSHLWLMLFFVGIIMSSSPLMYAGIGLFAVLVIFQVITLPVEFDASARALRSMQSLGIVSSSEHRGARKVLKAAALTYVAAMLAAVANLVRLILIAGRRND